MLTIRPGAARQIIETIEGDSFAFRVVWTNEDETPIDFTGGTVALQARAPAGGDPVLDLSDENGITTDPENGEINIEFASPSAGTYAWDLRVTTAAGKIHTVIGGTMIVLTAVTS
jgi:hypothetical protein